MNHFQKDTKFHSSSYIIETYHNGIEKEIILGYREIIPTRKKCTKNTLYDIASLTKVYTATVVYIAYEEGKLNLNEKIKDIDNRFVNLNNIKILDLLSHNQEIWTKGYLGDAKTKKEFYEILFTAYIKSTTPTYLDIHYIILSTLLEKIYKKSFEEILKEKIFQTLELKKTTVSPMGNNIASNNFETLNEVLISDILPGCIHDKKARVAKNLGIITGHASIFTTGKELLEFLKSFLNNKLLTKETIALMLNHKDRNQENYNILKSIVSEKDRNKMYEEAIQMNPNLKLRRTYNNMGTRYRNDIQILNDVPKQCSENTIAFSGYTGPSFIIDFDAQIIVVVLCNVMHNTKLSRYERKKNTEVMIQKLCNQLYE